MEKQTIETKALKANSFEVGKAGNRFKVYYEDVLDLKNHLNGLVEAGLIDKDEINGGKFK